jgi:15-cis-phytoene synthase
MPLYLSEGGFATARDHAACRAAIRQGSRTFFAASLLLPSGVRQPAYGLYAFCRLSDDAVDLVGGLPSALERLRDRLARAYDGQPLPYAADRAMADLVRRFAIPRALPDALLEGLAWDAQGRRFEDLADLQAYAARVAGTVGVMMALIMGVRSQVALARASELGVAMQLTNIARDVGEDARAGRLYLPLRWLREAGIDPAAFLIDPVSNPPLKGVVARLLDEADKLYQRARAGISLLPIACRPAILSAALLYSEIGRELERLSLDSIAHRARVSGPRKAQLLAKAMLAAPWRAPAPPVRPLDAVYFLIDAVMRAPTPPRSERNPTRRNIRAQFLRVLEMFERLERAEQFGEQAHGPEQLRPG